MASRERRHKTSGTARRSGFAIPGKRAATLISLLLIVGALLPATARASVLGDFFDSIKGKIVAEADSVSTSNVQTMPLLRPAKNIDPAPGRGGGDVIIVNDSALMPEEGPSGTITNIEKPKNSTISIYVVREGDTLSTIGKLFGVSVNTILWANNLPRASSIKEGQTLTILPVTGVKYTTKKGDTLASVAKKFGGDADEIASFNGLDSTTLAAGVDILIPDGEVQAAPASSGTKSSSPTARVAVNTAVQSGYFAAPLAHYVRTQGIHGYNGVDLASSVGTPILASAGGDVIISKETGWNGGYGKYVVIQHPNGSQTLYAHQSSVLVSVGEHVEKGETIGYVGNSGKSTGPHLHFEIRNGVRNPF